MVVFLAGLDYSIIMSTLVLYLNDLVKVSNPNLYYSIILGAFAVSSILVGTVCGRFVDRTRNLKMYIILVLLLMLIGNLFYAVYLHPAFLIIGRFLAGIGDSFMGVSAGELVRLHNRKDGTKAIWVISAAFSMGFTSGPVFGIMFKGINITIGSFVVNYLNFIGIFVAGLSNYSLDILLPLIIYDLLQWNQLVLTITVVITAVPFFGILYVFSKFCMKDKREYYACIFGICCTLICFCVIFEFKVLRRNHTRDMWLMAVFIFGYIFIWFPDEVFLTSMLAKKVPPSIQSFAHGLRSSLGMFATVIPSFTTPLLMPWIHILAVVLIIAVSCNLVYFFVRMKSMTNIKVISPHEKPFYDKTKRKVYSRYYDT
ncbi:uncharacterized protein LOC130646037 [Hydractinia symbiolongicarpus]|uniref:uncharacterized protein LOC130646037 n=1 Tax=Hydractinia symbiolongicarpus TaxID=13093 RepID=UPI0025514475|nr:uncharacterized protein LOC130646037 [Hydractinia symbiolongicarpus]